MLVILLCFNAAFTSGIVNGTGTTSPAFVVHFSLAIGEGTHCASWGLRL